MSFTNLCQASLKLSLAASLLFGAIMPVHAEGIGVVDNVEILDEYPAYKRAQEQIVSERQKLDELFSSMRENLKTELQDPNLSEAQKLQKQKEAQQQFLAEKQKFDEMVSALRSDIESDVTKAVSAEARSQGLDIVLSKDAALYGGKDITTSVVQRLQR